MRDYKYEMQMEAEERAEKDYGREFYSLDSAAQSALYNDAIDKWCEDRMLEAEIKEGR